jgi:hypothetical protein
MVADHWIEPLDTGALVTLRFAFGGLFGGLMAMLYGKLAHSYLQRECAAYQRRLQQ